MSIQRAVGVLMTGAVLITGCSTTVTPATTTLPPGLGVVTGVASPCWPYANDRGIRKAAVTVTVVQDDRAVASQTVRGDHVYRVELAPGAYTVSTPYSKPEPVSVVDRRTQRVDLPDDCV